MASGLHLPEAAKYSSRSALWYHGSGMPRLPKPRKFQGLARTCYMVPVVTLEATDAAQPCRPPLAMWERMQHS